MYELWAHMPEGYSMVRLTQTPPRDRQLEKFKQCGIPTEVKGPLAPEDVHPKAELRKWKTIREERTDG